MRIGYLMQEGVPDLRSAPESGPSVHVRQVITELQKLGCEVTLLASLDGRLWKSHDLVNYLPVRVPGLDSGPLRLAERVIRRVQHDLHLPYAAWFESNRMAAACRQELPECDLFYERMGWMGYGGALAARKTRIPLVLEVNGDHLTEFKLAGVEPHGMQRRLSLLVTRWAARSANHVVTTGDGWRERFIQTWGVAPHKVTTIENGSQLVDLLSRESLVVFKPPEQSNTVTLAFVGGFEPWQGLPVLFQAMALAVAQGVDARLVVVGDESGAGELRTLVDNLSLQERTEFKGRLPAARLGACLAAADIGVSAYCGRAEYSGLKLLDYKAAGLAVIASGEAGQPAILQHGVSGWIVPPCDAAALAGAIVHLAINQSLRRKLGQAARVEAEQCHRWRHTAQQLVSLFERVLQEKRL